MIAYFGLATARTRRARQLVRALATGLALTSLIACEDLGEVLLDAGPADGGGADPNPSLGPRPSCHRTQWSAAGRIARGVELHRVPGTQCRDGSPTGVAVNFGSSNQLLIYLACGGWCIDEESCSQNPDGPEAQAEILALGLSVGVGGVFDRANLANPARDWNFVYVPYCTSDMHAGANPCGDVPGFDSFEPGA